MGKKPKKPIANCDSEPSLESRVLRGLDLVEIWGFIKEKQK